MDSLFTVIPSYQGKKGSFMVEPPPIAQLTFSDANEAHGLAKALNDAIDDFEAGKEKKSEPSEAKKFPKAKKLTKKIREGILAMRSGQGSDDEEIAEHFGFPVERIQKVINEAKGE